MNVTITEHEPVATVCGNEVRIYGGKEKNGIRPLRQIKEFAHRGAAVLYATEFDDTTKRAYQR